MNQEIATPNRKNRFEFLTSIWIVPIIALFIAFWLAYQYYVDLGSKIEIEFKENSSLKAGESQIRYKDIPVGVVKHIRLKEDGDGVIVTARMDREIEPYLNKKAKFWIVRPHVGFSGVSGLDTLISGTYINMEAVKEDSGKIKKEFVGINNLRDIQGEGRYCTLYADNANNLSVGAPVFYRGIAAGEVVEMKPSREGHGVRIGVYIEPHFTDLLGFDTDFWINNLLDIEFKGNKIGLSVSPITTLIQGAISFSASKKKASKEELDAHIFKLRKSKDQDQDIIAKKSIDANIKEFIITTDGEIGSLTRGSSVKFQGFDIGKIVALESAYNAKSQKIFTEICVLIDLGFFHDPSLSQKSGFDNFNDAIKQGLRAFLSITDPITNRAFIELKKKKGVKSVTIVKVENDLYRLPALEAQNGGLMGSLEDAINSINKTAKNYGEGSLFAKQMTDMMREITQTSSQAKELLKHLDEKPNALIFGGGE
ncbi:MAG: MCE family protein [Campylobacterales bacterium]|nr:MCE family protein [Campylobacterales bacterium]